jgi:electron transfer flavoprotein alpha/beta subunit
VVIRAKVLVPLSLYIAPLVNDKAESAKANLDARIDDADRSCVHQALRLRTALPSCRVTVLVCGGGEGEHGLREFAIRGVDGILQVTLSALELRNPASMLEALLLALDTVHFDLVLISQATASERDLTLRAQGRAMATHLRVPYYEIDEIVQIDLAGHTFTSAGAITGEIPSVVSLRPQEVPYVTVRDILQARRRSPHVDVNVLAPSPRAPGIGGMKPAERWPPGSLGDLYPEIELWHPDMRRHYRPLEADAPLLPQILRAGFELDQRLDAAYGFACDQAAVKTSTDEDIEEEMLLYGHLGPGPPVYDYAAAKFYGIRDSFLLPFLINAEPLLRRGFHDAVGQSGVIQRNRVTFESEFEVLGRWDQTGNLNSIAGVATTRVFSHALMMASMRGDHSLRCEDVQSAALRLSLALGEDTVDRPMFADWVLDRVFGYTSLRRGHDRPLSESPEAQTLLALLLRSQPVDGDFQFFMGLAGDKPELRVCTLLEDFWQRAADGSLRPLRAILLQYADRYWHFEQSQIDELNALIQSAATKEADLQRFLERNPHFLRTFDHREVYPHVVLQTDDGKLIPDFIVTNAAAQEAIIVELKAKRARVVVHGDRATRFSMAVFAARAQLLRYRRWLDRAANRKQLESLLRMKDYRLRLGVVIGRSSEFRSARERQELTEDHPDIQVLTYDDLIQHATRERQRSKAFWKR